MTTRDYLGQLLTVDKKIQDKIAEAEQWRTIALGSIGGGMNENKVQTSKKYDKMGDAIALAVDYEQEALQIASKYAIIKHEITKQIDDMPEYMHYIVLKDHYILGKSMSDIAESNCYSSRQIYRVFYSALDKFEELYGEKYIK